MIPFNEYLFHIPKRPAPLKNFQYLRPVLIGDAAQSCVRTETNVVDLTGGVVIGQNGQQPLMFSITGTCLTAAAVGKGVEPADRRSQRMFIDAA
jgi:hypothetical protein